VQLVHPSHELDMCHKICHPLRYHLQQTSAPTDNSFTLLSAKWWHVFFSSSTSNWLVNHAPSTIVKWWLCCWSINQVTLCQAQLILRFVTICGYNVSECHQLGLLPSVEWEISTIQAVVAVLYRWDGNCRPAKCHRMTQTMCDASNSTMGSMA